MYKKIGLLIGAFLRAIVLNANAATIPYGGGGTEAPANSFVASATGDVTAYFYATDAGYDSEIGLLVNGVSTGVFGLANHTSGYGQSLVLGSVNAGDTLEFQLKVITTSGSWYTLVLDNSDGKNHAYSTGFAGDWVIPAGTYIGFEDLPNGASDFDYNDHQFVFTNVQNTRDLPEPAGLGLLGLGIVAIGFARKRKAK